MGKFAALFKLFTNKFAALFKLFTTGKELTNAVAWTNASIVGNFVLALLGGLAALGYTQFNLTPDQFNAVVALVVAGAGAFNAFMHTATDARVGLPLPPHDSTNAPAGGDDGTKSKPEPDIRDPGGA